MNRIAIFLIALMLVACSSIASAETDVIEAKLIEAKKQYDSALAMVRDSLLEALAKKITASKNAGDLKAVEAMQSEFDAFEQSGKMPRSIPTKGFESQVKLARTRMEEAFADSIRQYTKNDKIEFAKAVQQELDEFKKGELVKVGGFKLPPLDAKEWSKQGNGLKVWDVKEGTGNPAGRGATIKVHYTGWLTNGTVFDSTQKKGEAVELRLTEVTKGWAEGVPGMKVGGVRRLVIPPELAYGKRGAGKAIPPDATLVFEIELLEVKQ
jgi:FKBP-type peptidyl-prolyl cis-trans isomerase